MPSATRCASCELPTQNLTLCKPCVTALRVELSDVAGLLPDANGRGYRMPSLGAEINTTRTRQDQLSSAYERWGGRRSEQPLPVKMNAGDALRSLRSVLNYWASAVVGHPIDLPASAAALTLMAFDDRLARHPDAGYLLIEITGAIHRARHAIDRPNDPRLYLGPCDNSACRRDVYGAPTSTLGQCVGCGMTYDIEARRRWLLDIAQDRLGTAVEVAGLLRAAGLNATSSQIRGYVHRGTLAIAGRNRRGHPMYRVGDALAEVLRAEANRASQNVSS